jgi:putative ABC transport system permease protein
MWKNYFKTSFRQLSKKKLYTSINVIGLSIGFLSLMAISLYIYHHWSYDRNFEDHDSIYQVSQIFEVGGNSQKISSTPPILANMIEDDIAGVEKTARLFNVAMFGPNLVKTDGENQSEYKFCYVDESFFELFNLEVLAGDPIIALSSGEKIVLTRSAAIRYYGSIEKAIDSDMTVGDNKTYQVGAILADLPDNIHFDYEFFAPFKLLRAAKQPDWQPSNYITYIKLHQGVDAEETLQKINTRASELLTDMMAEYHFKVSFDLHSLASLHFGEEFLSGAKPTIDVKYLYIFGFAALLIILIAAINYINLATAESGDKNKETGIRKVMGASRSQLIKMYLAEAGLLVIISLLIAYFLIYILFPQFKALAGINPDIDLLFSFPFILFFLVTALLIALLSGFYPSWMISALQPVQSLKSKGLSIGKGGNMRKVLVVFQFFVSMFMIIATAIIYFQLNYIQNKNLGYDKERVITMPLDYKMQEQLSSIKSELKRQGLAHDVAVTSDNPVVIKAGYRIIEEGKTQEYAVNINGLAGDPDMAVSLGLKIVAGNDLSEQDANGTGQDAHYMILINETAAKAMGYSPEEAILKKVDFGGRNATIKGVVQDFHFSSLHEQIKPLGLFIEPEQGNYLVAKLQNGDIKNTLAGVESIWKKLVPHRPFEYQFLDDKYNALYEAETKIGQVFTTFSIIAICIACLGLFGLVSFVANKRSKEISIRKVLGANSLDVLKLLSFDFVKLLLISAIIAIVAGIYFSDTWLQNFAYRTDLPLWIYVVSVIVVMTISLITIWYKSLIVAHQNPVDNLKSE